MTPGGYLAGCKRSRVLRTLPGSSCQMIPFTTCWCQGAIRIRASLQRCRSRESWYKALAAAALMTQRLKPSYRSTTTACLKACPDTNRNRAAFLVCSI